MYKKLHIADFRLYRDTDILFGKYITVLAGRNSTGKSTILGLVANSAQLPKYHTYFALPSKLNSASFSEAARSLMKRRSIDYSLALSLMELKR